jgi:hypothetical protein
MDDKGSVRNADGPSALKIMLHVPRQDIEKFQEISGNENYGTNLSRYIRDETRGMDLHIGTIASSNSSALKVVCPPPGIEAKF